MELMMERDTTEKRLDELTLKVERGFAGTDKRLALVEQRFKPVESEVRALGTESRAEFTALRSEMKAGFEQVDKRFERMEVRLDERFDALHRTMIQFLTVVFAALLGVIATMIAAQF